MKPLKVGILTLPLHTNYGGIIQAYAMQRAIEKLGHESSHVLRHLIGPFVLYKDLSEAEIDAYQQHTQRFIDRYIRCDETPLAEIDPKRYDAIVVGSDQIWRNRYDEFFHIGIRNAFLDFAKSWNIRRIAYAPSFGIDRWEAPESEIPACAELLKKFDAVSCREDSGVKICRETLGVESQLMIDPTLLLEGDDYRALIDPAIVTKPTGDMLAYVLDRDEEKQKLIDRVATSRSLTPHYMNDRPDAGKMRVQPPVEQWLYNIANSKLVMTDSFHATVFSILFNTPFVVTGNPTRGLSRIESLLRLLGLEDHLALTADDFDPSRDYSVAPSAYEKLRCERERARAFLKGALG